MVSRPQNLGTKGLTGKILRKKELAAIWRWRVARIPIGWVGEAPRTVPVWAFHILGQGCSSQRGGIFLWKAVEKLKQLRAIFEGCGCHATSARSDALPCLAPEQSLVQHCNSWSDIKAIALHEGLKPSECGRGEHEKVQGQNGSRVLDGGVAFHQRAATFLPG